MKSLFLAASAGILLASSALAADPPRVEIPFANHGGIDDWKADGHDAILIRSQNHHYYRATFMSRCEALPFAETIGFETSAGDVLDKFDSVLVHGESCQFASLTEIPRPKGW